jgi:hypothetical protein
MKTTKSAIGLITLLLMTLYTYGQTETNSDNQTTEQSMKTYIIEREIPDAGKLTSEQLKGIAQKSNEVVGEMGSQIEWVKSYVTDNTVYCVYRAENAELILKHAEKGGFPANKISELATTIDPGTAKKP